MFTVRYITYKEIIFLSARKNIVNSQLNQIMSMSQKKISLEENYINSDLATQ